MAWTALMTFTANSVLTAAQLNTYIGTGGNLSHTAPAVVTTAGDTVYATGANTLTRLAIGASSSFLGSTGSAPVWRTVQGDLVVTSQATTSGSYVDLATVGPQVTVTTGTRVAVFLSCKLESLVANTRAMMSFAVSGASTLAADDSRAWGVQSNDASDPSWGGVPILLTSGLTAGSNTFTAKYLVTTGTGTFADRRIGVIPF